MCHFHAYSLSQLGKKLAVLWQKGAGFLLAGLVDRASVRPRPFGARPPIQEAFGIATRTTNNSFDYYNSWQECQKYTRIEYITFISVIIIVTSAVRIVSGSNGLDYFSFLSRVFYNCFCCIECSFQAGRIRPTYYFNCINYVK